MTSQRDQAVDVLVEQLGSDAIDPAEFYDRLCAAVCRLTRLERAILMLYDPAYRAVRTVGSAGVDPDLARQVEGTLADAPLAQRALEQDDVVIASGDLRGEIPVRFADTIGTNAVACVPVSAGGAWLGVIFADCNGAEFELDESERLPLRTLARGAALVASVERSTSMRERANRLSERIALAREIHDQVIQRLFGLSLVLGAEGPLSDEDRKRAHAEVRSVLAELRGSLERQLAPPEHETKTTLRRMLERLEEHDPRVRVDWQEGVRVPARLEALLQSVLAEAMRNADKHANASEINVVLTHRDGALTLQIVNDGVHGTRQAEGGLGLKLAGIEALQREGVLEYGPYDDGRWRVRIVCPIGEGDADG
ncbi:MAG TPA: GAF domain-containing protein [Solirubrobacterales bacterium]|jgi:signal transduction histidine kinase